MKILSLFDGMSCGMLAMMESGVKVDRYCAFEIDKYAKQTSKHNFPQVEQYGDVFEADFTQFKGFDFLIGGSPCTYWSIAQKNNRETVASGLGWDLFQQYVRALNEATPMYFIYENNKSMSDSIRDSIRKAFGFEEICINSALVSAQNRQRYYWVGKRQADGTYRKVHIEQPEDRGILLRDVLEGGMVEHEKGYCCTHLQGNARDYFKKNHTNIKFEPVFPLASGKSRCVTAHYSTKSKSEILECHYSDNPAKQKWDGIAEPVRVGCMPSPDGTIKNSQGMRLYSVDGKSVNQVSNGGGGGAKTGLYAVPVNTTPSGKSQTIKAQYQKTSVVNICCFKSTYGASGAAEPVCKPVGTTADDKAYCITANYNGAHPNHTITKGVRSMVAEPTPCYAMPCAWDEDGKPTKAISYADGKPYTVYEVYGGQITIKGKQYPIKLVDGYYIIRKPTVRECARLQTIPEWFEFPVSDTQAFRQIGNGWTILVISHIINACIVGKTDAPEWEQLSIF